MMRKRNRHLRGYGRARRPAARIVIVCDDTKTAPNYFAALKAHILGKVPVPPVNIDIRKAPRHGTSLRDLIAHAETFSREIRASDGDSLWVLIDLEQLPDEPAEVKTLRGDKAPKRVRPAVSKPCFEVRTLHHLVDTGKAFRDCSEVNQELRRAWKKKFACEFGNKKAQADYAKIADQ